MLPFDAKKLQEPPKFVHRLSTEITGILLLARHKAAAAYAKAFLSSTWKKDVITLKRSVFNPVEQWGFLGGDIIEHGFCFGVFPS